LIHFYKRYPYKLGNGQAVIKEKLNRGTDHEISP